MAVLSSFCGILTLQVGAVILASVIFTIAAVLFSANIFDYHNSTDGWDWNLTFMLIFMAGLIIIGWFMFASAYAEVKRWAIVSVIGLLILTCYWVILCGFSFLGTSDHVRAVCIRKRCPESFWIANINYRKQSSSNDTTTTAPLEAKRRRRDSIGLHSAGYGFPEVLGAQSNNRNDTWNNSIKETEVMRHVAVFAEGQISQPKRDDGTWNHLKGTERHKRHGIDYGVAVIADGQGSEPKGHEAWNKSKGIKDERETRDGRVSAVERLEPKTQDTLYNPSIKSTPIKCQNRQDDSDNTNSPPIVLNVEVKPDGKISRVKRYSAPNIFKPFFHKNIVTLSSSEDEDVGGDIVHGFPFSGAVVLFLANLIFLIFTILVMWSWASELDLDNWYVDEEPVVVYDE